MSIRKEIAAWYARVTAPQLQILKILPGGASGLVGTLVLVNFMLGLLPVGFIGASSWLIATVPRIVEHGMASRSGREFQLAFAITLASFLGQQILSELRSTLGDRLQRRVDGHFRDETLLVATLGPSIAPLDHPRTLNALSEICRLLETTGFTPGAACAGFLALIARYVRMGTIIVLLCSILSWQSAAAAGATALLFRFGHREGVRRWSQVWRDVSAETRRLAYLHDLAMAPPASKEIRIFGIIDWLTQLYQTSFINSNDRIAARRRQIFHRPFVLYGPIGVTLAVIAMTLLARDALSARISLGQLAAGAQAITALLLLGEHYPESDVSTQYGTQAIDCLDEARAQFARTRWFSTSLSDVPASIPEASLEFEDVSFHYPDAEQKVLDRLTLKFEAGKCTAIVGENGAGKTTLVQLLTQLYQPTTGRITADGIDIATISPQRWRRQLSVVFQDFMRYELSAADNIAFGAPHVPRCRAAIERAAARAGLLHILSAQPLGLDTPLARDYSNGVDLSGGQWQRVALARALYAVEAGARVLVLDEPTAALDVRAEMAFLDDFIELTHGVTSILISHRFSSVRRADHIVVIGNGRVVEAGNHNELLAARGQYARLFRMQAERFENGGSSRTNGVSVEDLNAGAS